MFEFFANTFGYVLNFIYNLVNNYGVAIILFTILVKIILLPISIKQQRTMKKSAKLQEQVKAIQFKYKNDPEKMNQEMMSLYKAENMSPLSGCLSSIIQIILLLSIFYLVRSPLTFMKHLNEYMVNKNDTIEVVQQLGKDNSVKISEVSDEEKNKIVPIINYYENKINENENMSLGGYSEISVIKYFGDSDEKIKLNMGFLGIDLSEVPNQNMTDFRVWIIPVLYIVSSFISIRLTTAMQQKNSKKKEKVIDITEDGEKEKKDEANELDMTAQTSKTMSWLMPIMAISIAFVAPLGLALYWLVNNVLMIIERVILDKVLKAEEE